MKKTVRILLPILLIAALLVVGYWFFFQYRTDFTAGILKKLGDSRLESGSYDAALRYYRLANDLAPEDGELSLSLAEAYRKSGNYTKTENVLVNAIYNAPEDTRLYVALSRVYVEQDKLLDARQMLDNIANPSARAELDRQRPAAPSASPQGSFYSEYVTVTLTDLDPEASCYYTVDGSCPSLERDAYTGPFTLEGGESTLCALAVDDQGLVSPALYEGYTIAGVIEDVEFRDPGLEAMVQELLHREGRTLQTDDLWGIEELTLPEELGTTADLSRFTGLNRLTARNLGELDYSFLEALPQLRYLDLEGCMVTTETLEHISACQSLEVLILADCGLSNVSPLGRLQGLRVLDLSDNAVSSVTPLMTISTLDELYLGHNALTSLPSMRELQALRVLDLSYNALDYVGSLSTCPTLERLNLSHNRLSALNALESLKSLVWFNGSNNEITDASPLAACVNLENFVMTDNKLANIDFLTGFAKLKEINIDYNDVEAVPVFGEGCPLESFSAAHNFLEDLSGLVGLQYLSYVNADYNNIRDISVLKGCPALTQVNVYGTYIRSGGVLADNGVIVNYSPGL